MRSARMISLYCFLISISIAVLISFGCSESVPRIVSNQPADEIGEVVCECELRSWVVAGRGRHLLLEIYCPEPYNSLRGVIEFGSASLRSDYQVPIDPFRAGRLAKMNPGERIRPFFSNGAERVEARWEILPEQAQLLKRDRVFESPYALLRTNSNAAMRYILEAAGLEIPRHVHAGGGALGEFPGINVHPGLEVEPASWPAFGLPQGPGVSP